MPWTDCTRCKEQLPPNTQALCTIPHDTSQMVLVGSPQLDNWICKTQYSTYRDVYQCPTMLQGCHSHQVSLSRVPECLEPMIVLQESPPTCTLQCPVLPHQGSNLYAQWTGDTYTNALQCCHSGIVATYRYPGF